MRNVVLAAVVSAAFGVLAAQNASAADLPVFYPAPEPPPAVATEADWAGCYIGANIGGGWASKAWINPPSTDVGSHVASGGFGGGQIGCDHQNGALVFGIEGMFDAANFSGSHTFDVPPTVVLSTDVDWFATATGRLGYAWGQGLLYVKGGAAAVGERHSNYVSVVPATFAGDTVRWGWTIGAGLEYAFAPGWSARLEYNYMDFGTEGVTLCASGTCTTPDISQSSQHVLVGLNYHFGRMH